MVTRFLYNDIARHCKESVVADDEAIPVYQGKRDCFTMFVMTNMMLCRGLNYKEQGDPSPTPSPHDVWGEGIEHQAEL